MTTPVDMSMWMGKPHRAPQAYHASHVSHRSTPFSHLSTGLGSFSTNVNAELQTQKFKINWACFKWPWYVTRASFKLLIFTCFWHSNTGITRCLTTLSPNLIYFYLKARIRPEVVACTCSPGYSRGLGRRVTWGRELKAPLGKRLRPSISKQLKSKSKWWL